MLADPRVLVIAVPVAGYLLARLLDRWLRRRPRALVLAAMLLTAAASAAIVFIPWRSEEQPQGPPARISLYNDEGLSAVKRFAVPVAEAALPLIVLAWGPRARWEATLAAILAVLSCVLLGLEVVFGIPSGIGILYVPGFAVMLAATARITRSSGGSPGQEAPG